MIPAKRRLAFLLVLGSLIQIQAGRAWTQENQKKMLHLDPEIVKIEMLYSGADVKVSTEIPKGYDLVLTCQGKESPVELKRKGKALGLLWMNVGDVKFEHVPIVYLLLSSRPLKELATGKELTRNGLGFDALEIKVSSSKQDPSRDFLYKELIKLKKSEGLFDIQENKIELSEGHNGFTRMVARFHLSAKTAPGTYNLSLFGFKQGHGELLQTAKLQVTQVGTSAFISSLAHEHGLLYGILAAIIAIVVGLLTGVAFSLGSKSGH